MTSLSDGQTPRVSLGELFESLATRTWHRIRDGELLSVPQGEVSLTDNVLLELARARHPGLVIAKTPINREPHQGTDWEWWIGSSHLGWLRYAIQAKRLHVRSGRYEALGHKVGNKRQIDVLLSYAARNDALPAYCLFNYVHITPLDPYWHCHRTIEPTQLGCSIAPATLVTKCVPRGTGLPKQLSGTFKSIHQQSSTRPWRCLVGCPEFAAAYSVGKGNRASLSFFGADTNALVHTDLPPRLRQLADGASNAGIVTTLSEEDFDWGAFRGESAEIPRYVVVVTLPTVERVTRSAVGEPLLLPEATGNPAGVTDTTRGASKSFKRIKR